MYDGSVSLKHSSRG